MKRGDRPAGQFVGYAVDNSETDYDPVNMRRLIKRH